jgi:translation initiation factor 2 subunit 3
MTDKKLPVQPTLNMGIVGHVDHGKTSITKWLSGKWTDTHSEEKRRGITIKLGYTNFTIYSNGDEYDVKQREGFEPVKKVSIVDAPGHESFMATMISGAAVMDCALLVIAANERCPQPQTIEHLKTLEIAGISQVVVLQNKIDLVTKEEAIENYNQIKSFLKGTIANDSPIVPVSAQYGANLSKLLELVATYFKEPKRSFDEKPLMHIIRSFDINKPGDEFRSLKGGVLGGSIERGCFSVGDDIEIKPGIKIVREGKTFYKPIKANIKGLMSDRDKLDEAVPGGSIAVMTGLDPSVTKTDFLVGQIAGLEGELPEPLMQLTFDPKLFDKVVTSTDEIVVKDMFLNEPLMLIVNSLTTVGVVMKANPKEVSVSLKRPVMAFEGDRAVIFRRFDNSKWRIIGHGIIRI